MRCEHCKNSAISSSMEEHVFECPSPIIQSYLAFLRFCRYLNASFAGDIKFVFEEIYRQDEEEDYDNYLVAGVFVTHIVKANKSAVKYAPVLNIDVLLPKENKKKEENPLLYMGDYYEQAFYLDDSYEKMMDAVIEYIQTIIKGTRTCVACAEKFFCQYEEKFGKDYCFSCLMYKKSFPDNLPECPICKNEIIGKKHTTLCNHVFHQSCIMDWFKKSDKCPMCRKQMEIESLPLPENTSIIEIRGSMRPII